MSNLSPISHNIQTTISVFSNIFRAYFLDASFTQLAWNKVSPMMIKFNTPTPEDKSMGIVKTNDQGLATLDMSGTKIAIYEK